MPASRQDLLKLAGELKTAKRVLITTHVRPDGDALGTSAAMHLGLKQLGIESEILLLSKLPTKYAFALVDFGIGHIDAEKRPVAELAWDGFDAFLVVDTGTWSQLPDLRESVGRFKGRKLVLDHHLTQEDWADVKLVDTGAGAASEVAAEVLDELGVEFDRAIAESLFLGITTDTGWFQYSNTTPTLLRLAARLVEAGVDADKLYQHLYNNERAERLALHARAIQSLKLIDGDRLAVMSVTQKDFDETRANVPDTENIINWPLQIRTVEVSLIFVEPKEPGPIRVSLRSKGVVDVAQFAQQFGGGGHARAAGLKLPGKLEDVVTQVSGAMRKVLATTTG